MNAGLSGQAQTITTAIQSAWTTINNEFGLSTRLDTAKTWGKSFIDKMNAGLSGQATTITTAIQSAWTTISNEFQLPSRVAAAFNWGVGIVNNLLDGVKGFDLTLIGTQAQAIWDQFKNTLSWNSFVNMGNVIMDALHQGIVIDKIAWLTGEITRGMQAIVDAVKRIFNIDSPSKVMLDIGANLMIGMERGISNNIPEVIKATQSMADGVMSVANGMSLSPSMALSTSPLGYASTGNIIRPSVTNNATYNLNYQTMQSAGSVQQDVELLNLLYGGAL
jgi:hypothetical protein